MQLDSIAESRAALANTCNSAWLCSTSSPNSLRDHARRIRDDLNQLIYSMVADGKLRNQGIVELYLSNSYTDDMPNEGAEERRICLEIAMLALGFEPSHRGAMRVIGRGHQFGARALYSTAVHALAAASIAEREASLADKGGLL